MDELVKALGPWPILQLIFGLSVLGLGIYSILKGLRGKEDKEDLESKKADWRAYEQLRHIEENSFQMVKLLEQQRDLLKNFVSVMWNKQQ